MSGGSGPGRPGPTPSDPVVASELRTARDRLIGDHGRRGAEFGRALAEVLDGALTRSLSAAADAVEGRLSLAAVGSYGRAELSPGSDVDVVLLHDGHTNVAEVADRLWYPLWDAGFVLGHAINTVKEEVALAERDLHALTAWLDARHVAGDPELFTDGVARIRRLAQRRRSRLIDDLRSAAEVRREKFGLVAEMLEPNLKDGSGGLRDAQSLSWAGWTLGEPGGWHALVEQGYLRAGDTGRLAAAIGRLLDVRVALHRVTGQPVRRADAPGAGCGRRRDGRRGRRRARARPCRRGALPSPGS